MLKVAIVFVLAVVAIGIVLDAALYVRGGWEATISYLALSRSRRYPILAVMVGVLIGHLFWPQPEPDDDGEEAAAGGSG